MRRIGDTAMPAVQARAWAELWRWLLSPAEEEPAQAMETSNDPPPAAGKQEEAGRELEPTEERQS